MRKQFGDYYLGLDIGTDSIGWAITDLEYKIQKLNGKYLWGIRLFDSGKSAADRRMYRVARRRNERKKQRIRLLQELFAEEIAKVDMGFFQRLNESRYYPDDKTEEQTNTLFNDDNFTDKDYHKTFPTIYHLRKALIENRQEAFDIRLVYLAIAHILKNRGHFLFEGAKLSEVTCFEKVFRDFSDCLSNQMELDICCDHIDMVENILLKTKGITARKKELGAVFGTDNKTQKAFLDLISGAKVSLKDLFEDESLDDVDLNKITFSGGEYTDNIDGYAAILGDRMSCIEKAKTVYDWALLSEILHGREYLSFAKVDIYEKHKKDLAILKKVTKQTCSHQGYKEIFSDLYQPRNYCAYIGKSLFSNNKSSCTAEEFYAYLKTKLKISADMGTEYKYVFEEIENKTFLPKQITSDNSVIPYQLNFAELEKILSNAAKYYPFLVMKDGNELTVSEKIKKIMTFRIPYYVGPLNDAHRGDGIHSNTWIVKKNNDKIRPWNFEEVVDLEESAAQFINRMTSKCTYLAGADVLPKNSLLYSEFMVLNELNNLRINGEKVSVPIKMKIYNDLFKKHRKVTQRKLRSYLMSECIIGKSDEISGMDGDFKSSLESYIDFSEIVGDRVNNKDMVEDIIRDIVLFGGDNSLLSRRLKRNYGDTLSAEQLKKICNLKYATWGRLSRELLTEVYDINPSTGELVNIITMMRESNENLMQLLGSKYRFTENINQQNAEINGQVNVYSYENLVADLYCSPAVKRGIWQTLSLIQEIIGFMGHEPKKTFVEVAREEGEKKRTISRRQSLIELYKQCKEEERQWVKELEGKTDDELRKDKLYLYYTQMGRCMYSGEQISLTDLYNDNIYDIDHIYPQSKTKDDSIENRVLVKKTLNLIKGDKYPLPQEFRTPSTKALWKRLYEMKLIGKTKYDRLLRIEGFSDEELAGFINRQLVETRQSTKAVAETLGRVLKEARVVYVKAGNVSDFRRDNNFLKVREINDYHHAKDAYLNIVVGNVFDTKFTHNPINFIKGSKETKYSLNRMYDFDIERGGTVAWKSGPCGTLSDVKKAMGNNRILFTRYAYEQTGGFFNQMPLKHPQGQFPLKEKDERLKNIERYGGYDNVYSAYYILVEHTRKGKRVRTIEHVPIHLSKSLNEREDRIREYCENTLQLESPRILLSKIKIGTLFNFDGFPMHLSGRTGDSLTFKPAVQLCVGEEQERYIKQIVKFVERKKKTKKEAYMVSEFDHISKEENVKIYDMLYLKHRDTIYNRRPSSQVSTLEEGREKFCALPIESQCEAIIKILKLFQCLPGSADLKMIGGSGQAGVPKKNKNISGCEKVKIINQSITGVFENEVDLLTL